MKMEHPPTPEKYQRPEIINWAHPNGHRAHFNWNGSVGGVKMAGPVVVFGPLSSSEPISITAQQLHDILVGHAKRIEEFITAGNFRDSLVISGWRTSEGALLATVVTTDARALIDKVFAANPQSSDRFLDNLSKEGQVVLGYYLILHTEQVSHYRVLKAVDSL